jgi:MaoC like domain
MMQANPCGHRSFDLDDQRRFASLSGDHNPVHLDPVVARRTQAGAPVVHGVHLVLWALDAFAAARTSLPPLRKLRVQFTAFAYLGESVTVTHAGDGPLRARLDLAVVGTRVARLTLEFGDSARPAPIQGALPWLALPREPLEPELEAMANTAGEIRFAAAAERTAELFPNAAAWLGVQSLAALSATSNLVGMIVPGMHSLYAGLNIAMHDVAPADKLRFRVIATDPRFRLVRTAIEGGGLCGEIESFARLPPAAQPAMTSLASLVRADEFAGSTALIVGASRGLGELTAKLIAAGGGRTILTYHGGKSDAERVASEIAAIGGSCDVIAYDARLPAQPQLEGLSDTPTHLYYFATPQIFRRTRDSRERLHEFCALYVDGFRALIEALSARRPDLSVFYPSSVAVMESERPRGMFEYATAKAAGERLCADLDAKHASLRISVERLPRLPTDQTASFVPVEESSVLETMLPIVRKVQAWPRP